MEGVQERFVILCTLYNQITTVCICCVGLCHVCMDWINEDNLWMEFNYDLYEKFLEESLEN